MTVQAYRSYHQIQDHRRSLQPCVRFQVEVSIKELCGESPGIRNKLKEALTNWKVPVEGRKSGAATVGHNQLLIMHLHTGCHVHIVVADEAGGLRALTPVIDGLHEVESVLMKVHKL